MNDDRGMLVWFTICAVIAVLVLGGVATAVVILFPHLIALIDRLGG